MPANVYDFGTDTGAFVTEPPSQWLLKGPSDSSPWTASYNSWILKEILADLEPLHDLYDSAGPGIQANKISPYGYPSKSSPVADDGILLSDWDSYGVWLNATSSRSVKLTVTGGHAWTWNADGTLGITSTTAIKGLRAGRDASSELRYGYDNAAYPTFRYECSPAAGGWLITWQGSSGTANNFVLSHSSADYFTNVQNTDAFSQSFEATCPIRIPYDTSRNSTKVVATLKKLGVQGLYSDSAISASVVVQKRNLSTGVISGTGLGVTSTATTDTDFSDTDSIDMDLSTYEYFVWWTVSNVPAGERTYVQRIYVEIEKRAVE